MLAQPSSPRWKNWISLPALVLLTIGFYWKLALTDQYVWFDHPDMCYLEIPRLQFQAREFHQGRFPLWDPHLWMGQPLIGQTQPGPLNPLNLLFLMLPLRDGNLRTDFLNWYYVAMHAVAAAAAYLLCRDLKRRRTASLLAACAFSFGGFMGTVAWLDVMSGALWTPVICLFFLRAARGIRPLANAALCGVFLGLAWLSGHHEIPILTSAAIAAGWFVAVCRAGRRALLPALLTFVIAGMTGAAQIWPTYEFGRLAKRWGGGGPDPVAWNDTVPYVASTIYSMPPRGLAGLLLPDQGNYADSAPFLGVIAVALAAYGLCSLWRLPTVRWFAVLAGSAAVFALGALTPLHGILYSTVPLLNKARVPVRALHLLNFAVIVLTAYGADQFLARRGLVWGVRIGKLLAATGAVILAGAIVWRIEFSHAMILSAFTALAFPALAAAWRAGRIRRASCAAMLLVLMLAELHAVGARVYVNRFEDNANRFARTLTENRDIADFLHREPAPRRVRVNDQDVPTNFGDLHSVDVMEGYVAGVTANLLRFGRHTTWAQRLYGASHYLGRKADRPGLVDAFEGQSGVKAFRDPAALPRARSVHKVETVASPAGLSPRMDDPAFDAGRTALLAGTAPELARCDGDTVEVLAYAPNRVRLRATMACRGMVVLSDTFYPGWRATVDGRDTHIWEVYGALRGVVVEGGAHEVAFHYRPLSVYGGIALSLAGVLAAAAIAGAGRLKSRSVPPGPIAVS